MHRPSRRRCGCLPMQSAALSLRHLHGDARGDSSDLHTSNAISILLRCKAQVYSDASLAEDTRVARLGSGSGLLDPASILRECTAACSSFQVGRGAGVRPGCSAQPALTPRASAPCCGRLLRPPVRGPLCADVLPGSASLHKQRHVTAVFFRMCLHPSDKVVRHGHL